MSSGRELEALLRLSCVPALGTRQLGRLLARYPSALHLLELPFDRLGPYGYERDSPLTRRRVERMLATIDALDVTVWSWHDAAYPAALRALADPPPLLFARGDAGLLKATGVAVVGTRSPTEYGISVCRMLAHGIADAGIVVWSGAARGIDAIAHRAALDARGGTVAVLGCGIDVAYPREHARLLDEIARDGLLLTEFLPGAPSLAHHFPQRNRILARLPKKVLVIEARVDGGALITAEYASGETDVMAVPGPIGRATSTGTNRLIQDGAKLVIDVADVLEELGGPLNAAAGRPRPSARRRYRRVDLVGKDDRDGQQQALGEERMGRAASRQSGEVALPPELAQIFELLEPHIGIHVDDLLLRTALPLPRLLGNLLRLINLGLVEDAGGKQFKRTPRPHAA